MIRNLIEKMTWLRALILVVMVALVAILSVVDYRLLTRPKPVAFVGQVVIPAEPEPSDEPTILVDVPVYGGDDDGILDPTVVIGIPLAEYPEDVQDDSAVNQDTGV